MGEYAVVWRDTEHPYDLYAGGLAVADDGLHLRGSAGRMPVAHRFASDEIEAVTKASRAEAIAGIPSLRIDLCSGRSLLLAGVIGVGVASELLETLTARA